MSEFMEDFIFSLFAIGSAISIAGSLFLIGKLLASEHFVVSSICFILWMIYLLNTKRIVFFVFNILSKYSLKRILKKTSRT